MGIDDGLSVSSLHDADLLQHTHQVIVESFFNYLSVLPCGNSTELKLELLICWRNHFPVSTFHRPLHRTCKFSHGASVVSLPKEDFVRIIHQMIVWKDFEELYSFGIMVMSSYCRLRLTGPINGNVFSMTLPESVPKTTSRSRIPRIV